MPLRPRSPSVALFAYSRISRASARCGWKAKKKRVSRWVDAYRNVSVQWCVRLAGCPTRGEPTRLAAAHIVLGPSIPKFDFLECCNIDDLPCAQVIKQQLDSLGFESQFIRCDIDCSDLKTWEGVAFK